MSQSVVELYQWLESRWVDIATEYGDDSKELQGYDNVMKLIWATMDEQEKQSLIADSKKEIMLKFTQSFDK